jgi:hypothetical protein
MSMVKDMVTFLRHVAALISSAARQPIMKDGALVGPEMIDGMTDASATRYAHPAEPGVRCAPRRRREERSGPLNMCGRADRPPRPLRHRARKSIVPAPSIRGGAGLSPQGYRARTDTVCQRPGRMPVSYSSAEA